MGGQGGQGGGGQGEKSEKKETFIFSMKYIQDNLISDTQSENLFQISFRLTFVTTSFLIS